MTDDLPYEITSINGRAMEWQEPLWKAIYEWESARQNDNVGRAGAVCRVHEAVEIAMRMARETR